MRSQIVSSVVAVLAVLAGCGGQQVVPQGSAPAAAPVAGTALAPWAYPVNPPASAAAAGGGGGGGGAAPAANAPAANAPAAAPAPMLTVPGSNQSFTMAQIRNLFDVADWRPDMHPAMPEVVALGRRPGVMACGYCHMPNGLGRPENASLAGLSADYIIQQMEDYRNDLRVSSEPRMGPPRNMLALAKAATDEEIRIAAAYFASLQTRPWIRVVETNTVPRTIIEGGMFVPAPDGGTEPLGQRLIEMPEDPARTALRDPASGFVAYAPLGSIARGRALVTTGGGRTIQCSICHGADLKGLGPVPTIAGRSPSQMARQLNDFRTGARKGEWSGLMLGVVVRLSPDDVIAITAYLATLEP